MTSRVLLALALLAVIGCKDRYQGSAGTESAVASSTDSALPLMPARNYKSVAEKVVAQSAGVKKGDLVLIFGSNEDLPLLEDIAVEVRKRGASPLVSAGTEQLTRRMYDEVPAQFDSQTPAINLKLAGIVDVVFLTESGEGRTLKGVPPERLAAQAKASAPVADLMRKRGVRTVALGNGLYPTAERADQFGISREELADVMFGGVDANYEELQAAGRTGAQAARRGQGAPDHQPERDRPPGTNLRPAGHRERRHHLCGGPE